MPLVLATLCAGCGSASPLLNPPPGPLIPPLPAAAQQPPHPVECRPTCSGALSTLLDGMQQSPTSAALPVRPASAPTKR